MKNLKRVLSLGLASVMLLGMMVMGASAATFTDQDEIKNTEAVNMMTSLNVINGKDTGAFDPNGTVTRAEMAKMITMILFGGEEATLTTSSTPKFTDVTTHWARKYIEYCAGEKQGIIAGNGDGTFAPDAPVTGTAAAKMALVALGYNASVYGFENNRDWDLNINTVANSKDANLYKGLKNLDPSKPITRDQAAQILFNALNAKIVEPTYTVTNNGVETQYTVSKDTTMLMDRFEVTVYVATLDKVVWDKDDEEYDYTFSNVKVKSTGDAGTISKPNFTEDMSNLFMQKVEIVTDDEGNILGIGASEDNNILASGIVSDLSAEEKDSTPTGKLKVGKTVVDVAGSGTGRAGALEIYNVNTATKTTVTAKAGLKDYWSVKVLDKDGDNKADVIVTYPVYVEKVTSVSRTGVSANGTYKFEDHTVEEGLKKDDYVIITKAVNTAGKAVVEKAEITTGTIRAQKTVDTKKQVQVGSTWYKLDSGILTTDVRGNSYDMVIVNGYIIKADKTASASADISDVALVTAADPVAQSNTIDAGTQKVQLMFSDGTKKIVTVSKTNFEDNGDVVDVTDDNEATLGKLCTFEVDEDGNYELKTIVAKDFGEESATLSSGAYKDGKVTTDKGSVRFNDDAVVFVIAGNGTVANKTFKVVSGADINGWEESTFASGALYANKDNGFLYTAMGLINLDTAKIPGVDGDLKHGVVVEGAVEATDEDGKKTVELTIWTGSENATVFTRESATIADFKAGTIVSYKTKGSDEITSLTAIAEGTTDETTYAKGAVKAYAGGEEIEIWNDNKVTKLDKDVTILGVSKDGKNYEGVEGAEIRLADQAVKDGALVADTWNVNVKYIFKTTGSGVTEKRTITLIIVETNNDFGETVKVNGSAPVTPETPVAKPATAFSLSASTAEVKADSKTATVTVTITPNDADSNDTVTATSADESKITTSVSGTTVTITLKDGYTATTDETVKVSVKVGNLAAQDVTVTIKA